MLDGAGDICAGEPSPNRVDLLWIPLGAGATTPVVRWSGRCYEAWHARRQRRERCVLYHSALDVRLDAVPYVVEMAPAWGSGPTERGVATEGPVGWPVLGRSSWFRYEVRLWRRGVIPDRAEAVGGPVTVTADPEAVRRVVALVPQFPCATWGRDERRTGDMWNSNSLVAWLLASSGVPVTGVRPPDGGRAPGWQAGLVAATR